MYKADNARVRACENTSPSECIIHRSSEGQRGGNGGIIYSHRNVTINILWDKSSNALSL